MADEYISNGSFKFGDVDMYETYGIRLVDVVEDYLHPKKRERKVSVPNRSGCYDFGANRYDERTIVLHCESLTDLTRAQWRELSYALSTKDNLYIFNEPTKYYVGELYEPSSMTRIPFTGMEFELQFTCEPFAYGEDVQEFFESSYVPDYQGTAYTPTRIELTNIGSTTIHGITVTIKERI